MPAVWYWSGGPTPVCLKKQVYKVLVPLGVQVRREGEAETGLQAEIQAFKFAEVEAN